MFQILGLYFITTYVLKIFCVIFHTLKCDTLLLVTYISFSDGPDQVSEIEFFCNQKSIRKMGLTSSWTRLFFIFAGQIFTIFDDFSSVLKHFRRSTPLWKIIKNFRGKNEEKLCYQLGFRSFIIIFSSFHFLIPFRFVIIANCGVTLQMIFSNQELDTKMYFLNILNFKNI